MSVHCPLLPADGAVAAATALLCASKAELETPVTAWPYVMDLTAPVLINREVSTFALRNLRDRTILFRNCLILPRVQLLDDVFDKFIA